MNPDILKIVALVLGVFVCVGSFFVPATVPDVATVRASLFGLGTGLLGWAGFKRPGDVTQVQLKTAKQQAVIEAIGEWTEPKPKAPTVPPMALLLMAWAIGVALLIVACGTRITWPSSVHCGAVADAVATEVRQVLVEHEDPEQALKDLAASLGEHGPETVLCAVSFVESLFAAKPNAEPADLVAAQRARAFLKAKGTRFQ